jgi:sugar/nucleoside kinase (ribokinase family)
MSLQPEKSTPEYLIIGHITRDLIEGGSRPGGTAIYSGILAQRMGLQVGLITSYQEDLFPEELGGFEIINHPTQNRTTFKNIYTSTGRDQYLMEKAEDLDFSLVPKVWQGAKIIHLGPVAQEVLIKDGFPVSDAAVAYSLQGWLRNWDQEGKVYSTQLPDLDWKVEGKTAAFLSIEDLGNDRAPIEQLRNIFPLLVLTKDKDGAEIYQEGEIITIPARQVEELDPTGAGDIFAAAFMIYWVLRGKSIQESGELAARLAALSITRPGLEGIPSVEQIQKIEGVH